MGRRPAAVYLAGAIAMRFVTEGTGVALALAAALELHSVALGGVLIAVFSAPSIVAAPLIGGTLDAARVPKRVLLGAALMMAAALAGASFLAVLPLGVVIVLLLAAGCVLPVFVGGLSAFVAEAMPGNLARGYAIDALSYNLAGIGGPALVTAVSATLSPHGALLGLAAAAVAGGLLLQLLPIGRRQGSPLHPVAVLRGVASTSRHMVRGALARVVAGGAVVQLAGGAGPIVAVLVAGARGPGQQAGGVLVTAFAVGGVAGALLVTAPPVRDRLARIDPALLMAASFGATGACFAASAFPPGFAATLVLFAVAGLPDAAGIAAMLRLRQLLAPPEVRAQVFVVASGTRVATAAVGAALAGLAVGLPPTPLLLLLAVPWLAAVPVLAPWRRRMVS